MLSDAVLALRSVLAAISGAFIHLFTIFFLAKYINAQRDLNGSPFINAEHS